MPLDPVPIKILRRDQVPLELVRGLIRGEKGDKGDKGDIGNTGPGVPDGGTTDQLLAKASNANQDGTWISASSLPISDATATALAGKANADDARLTDSREWSADTINQAEAEEGVATNRRAFTAQRVRQAVTAWWLTISSELGRGLASAANEAAARTLLGLGNSATRNVGTTAGTVAAGDDARFNALGSSTVTINGAENTNIGLTATQQNAVVTVNVAAGSGGYTPTLTLLGTNAQAAAFLTVIIKLPESNNPRVELRNLTADGALLDEAIGNGIARQVTVRLVFDGTNWVEVARTPKVETFEFTPTVAPAGASFVAPSSWDWASPVSAVLADLLLCESGGGGGSGRRGAAGTNRFGGGGGAAGAVNRIHALRTFAGVNRYVVGIGGIGGAAVTADNADGNPGSRGQRSDALGFSARSGAATSAFGSGGTSTTAAGGRAGNMSMFRGGAGGGGSSGAAAPIQDTANLAGSSGGGGGGGVSAANVQSAGGAQQGPSSGGTYGAAGSLTAGAAGGGNGLTPSAPTQNQWLFTGGSGGGGNAAGPGGNGGNGQLGGGGGGGGGASVNGHNSGAGGNGGDGLIRVTFYY